MNIRLLKGKICLINALWLKLFVFIKLSLSGCFGKKYDVEKMKALSLESCRDGAFSSEVYQNCDQLQKMKMLNFINKFKCGCSIFTEPNFSKYCNRVVDPSHKECVDKHDEKKGYVKCMVGKTMLAAKVEMDIHYKKCN